MRWQFKILAGFRDQKIEIAGTYGDFNQIMFKDQIEPLLYFFGQNYATDTGHHRNASYCRYLKDSQYHWVDSVAILWIQSSGIRHLLVQVNAINNVFVRACFNKIIKRAKAMAMRRNAC